MSTILLEGYLPDHELMGRVCIDAGFEAPKGHFTRTTFESDEDISDELASLIRTTFMKASAPKTVTMRQARLALLQSGLLSTINAVLTELTGDAGEAARIEWEYATEVSRNWPVVVQLATHLNLSDEQMDELFFLAATL